jgi:small subunit ribosomal protein S20
MPRRRTSLKSNRKSIKRKAHNLKITQALKRAIKKFNALIADKKAAEAATLIQSIYSQLDKAAKKQILHQQTANRKKSRLTLLLHKSA